MTTDWRRVVAFAVGTACAAAASGQVDDRMARVNEGTSPRVFAVDVAPDNAVSLSGPTEVRQERPPHHYAVLVRNASSQPVAALTVMMAIVQSDGAVKAFQELPAVKNLKAGQSRRHETRVRAAVLSPTDRIAFVLKTLARDGGAVPWQASDDGLRRVIGEAAKRVPVP